ncbi:MAG: hypothetical protein Q9199_002444 [Rusavskia elegans]
MAPLTYDSELMNQQVAAIAVPNSHDFVSLNDANGKRMIFSLGTDGIFYLCKEDQTGARVVINLSSALRVAPAGAMHFNFVLPNSGGALTLRSKIIDWLVFIFNWKDIQNTHKSIVSIVKVGLSSGSANLTTYLKG